MSPIDSPRLRRWGGHSSERPRGLLVELEDAERSQERLEPTCLLRRIASRMRSHPELGHVESRGDEDYVRPEGQEPVRLIDWLRSTHAEVGRLEIEEGD